MDLTEWLTPWLFVLTLLFNVRAAWKLAIDWKGMATTIRFVRDTYARRDLLPSEEDLEQESRAPVFLHLLAAYQEPAITTTLRELLRARYPHGKVRYVVVTRTEEDEAPHPAMEVSTGALCRRFLAELPPYVSKHLTHLTMPGPGRKAEQLNWALRPEVLASVLEDASRDPSRVFVAVSDADSVPDPDTLRWIAGEELAGRGALAYQGVTLSLANWEALDTRGRICAIQQSSIFTRVSLARLINEPKRVRAIEAVARFVPGWLGRWVRPVLEFCFRRSQICLGHNQFVRLDILRALGGFPTRGATEDSTLGYMLGARAILIRALPMIELTDLPETKEKIIRQNARWYKGVLDDVGHLWETWRAMPSAFNLAQVIRHVANKVVEWPIAAGVYPLMGYLGWHFAYAYRAEHPLLFGVAVAVPTVSLFLTVWVGGIVTQREIQAMEPYLPRPLRIRWGSVGKWLLATFRCQRYWLLATRAAWRVLWQIARYGQYQPTKTDRVTVSASESAWRRRLCHPLAAPPGQVGPPSRPSRGCA
jgi:hypothetical protein